MDWVSAMTRRAKKAVSGRKNGKGENMSLIRNKHPGYGTSKSRPPRRRESNSGNNANHEKISRQVQGRKLDLSRLSSNNSSGSNGNSVLSWDKATSKNGAPENGNNYKKSKKKKKRMQRNQSKKNKRKSNVHAASFKGKWNGPSYKTK